MVDNEVKLALLSQVEFFRGLDIAELELIVQRMTDQLYSDGDIVVREGDPGDRMFLADHRTYAHICGTG